MAFPAAKGTVAPASPAPATRLTEEGQRIHAEAVAWLQQTGCLHLVAPLLLEEYADSLASAWAWRRKISNLGLILDVANMAEGRLVFEAGKVIPSPHFGMAQTCAERADKLWDRIWAIVRDNSQQAVASGGPHGDEMARFLASRQARRT